MSDWYGKILPDSFKPSYENPSFDSHLLKLPFRCCIIGGSGSGKTTLVMEMIKRIQDTFGLIILCTKNSDEPLYNFLRTKIKPEQLHIYEDGNVPELEKYKDENCQIFLIFDDLVNESKKKQEPIISWFIRGRKIAGGVSMCYLSQSYFGIPKTIRIQSNYIMLKKLTSTKDLNSILRDFSLGLSRDELLTLYRYATDDKKNFLLVDIDSPPENRFRRNFLEVIPVPEF